MYVKISQPNFWYLCSLLVFVSLAIGSPMASERHLDRKGFRNSPAVKQIATKISNPAPSIKLQVVSAPWCAPCRKLKPVLSELKKEGYSVKVYDYEDEDAPDIGDHKLPYLRWNRFEKVAKETEGFQGKETLKKIFSELEGSIFD